MNHNLLIEIGTEEMPSSYMIKLEKDLNEGFTLFLTTHFLPYHHSKVLITPRRMVFSAEGVAPKQDIPEKIVKGPPVKNALAEDGTETPALKGFLEKCHATEYSIEGLYVFAKVKGKNEDTIPFFQNEFPVWLLAFPFEKKMRWEEYQFIRPIRWMVAFYGTDVINLSLCGITCSQISRSLRGFESERIESADDYFQKISASGIVLSSLARKEIIISKLKDLNQNPDEAVIWENVNRTEIPTLSEATFSEQLLTLPPEVISTVISNQLKCFPAWENAKLLPKFFFVMNGYRDVNLVRKGYEKVISARLNDAKYFYERDLLIPLVERIPDLEKMTFIEKLGTLADKTNRLLLLAKQMNYLGLDSSDTDDFNQLISLCKVDLSTTMVQELTELQGTIGKIYAKEQGIKDSISLAIEDHYSPRSEGDSIPSTLAGSLLGIIDRVDTISGVHAIGMSVSSSSDPLGLRRIANGLIRILIACHYPVDWRDIFKNSLEIYQTIGHFTFDSAKVLDNILVFFVTRLRSILSLSYRYDVVNAVVKEEWADPYTMNSRCKACTERLDSQEFRSICDSYTRIKNITKEKDPLLSEMDPHIFTTVEEQNLWEAMNQIPLISELENPREVLTSFFALNEPIARFFDKILVMDEDLNIRNHRLALLDKILKKMNQLADFSRIVFEGGDK